jgi:predicted NBD/HSP70 family sugar kinase
MYESMVWRHSEDEPDREESIDRIAGMLNALAALARTTGLKLAPFVGVACPGDMDARGRLRAGTQNLPGDWEAPFDFPRELASRLDRIGGARPQVAMHNDAVVQGLAEHARMRGVRRWGVFTVGTGLGNASYTRRA